MYAYTNLINSDHPSNFDVFPDWQTFLASFIKTYIMATLQKLNACLWFDKNAEEAVNFYKAVFKNASIGRIAHYTGEGKEIHGMDKGTVLTIEFELEGMQFIALNGGPHFKFTEAVSFVINCDTQEEIDYYWAKLSADPKSEQCGWLKDKFGLSWQVNATPLNEMLLDKDIDKANRAMKAMLQMKKLDIAKLQEAFEGKE